MHRGVRCEDPEEDDAEDACLDPGRAVPTWDADEVAMMGGSAINGGPHCLCSMIDVAAASEAMGGRGEREKGGELK